MSENQKILLRQFDSIHKFVDHLSKNPDSKGSSHTSNKEWAGTASFEEAVEFAKYGGWEPKYAPSVRSGLDGLIPKLRTFKDSTLHRQLNTSGDEVNVGLYVQGDPDHMVDWVPDIEMVSKRAVCLVIGHSVSAGCSAQDLFARGQALIGLVRALSLFGFELEIWSEETVSPGFGGSGGNGAKYDLYSTLVRLHAAGEIMDESAVEFAIGNPSWLRRLLFASQENESLAVRRQFGFGVDGWGGYGSIRDIEFGEYLNADLKLNLGHTWFNNRDPEGATEWVVKQLQELNVLPEDLEWEDDG